jgi:5-methyltetrahydrofolate--homocysteine methyltransferase
MIATAEDLRVAGVDLPILVGGAALSRNFTVNRIRPAYGDKLVLYAKDAMDGLSIMNRLADPAQRDALFVQAAKTDERPAPVAEVAQKSEAPAVRSPEVSITVDVPSPPDLAPHHERWNDLDDVWSWINPAMLYGRHMGLKDARTKIMEGDEKAMRVVRAVDEVKAIGRAGAMQVEAVWRFFKATSAGNRVTLFHEDGREAAHFDFPRQRKPGGLCLADYVMPPRGETWDHVAMFVTTAGRGIRVLADQLKQEGKFVRCHAIQALAVESAEAAAELVHAKIRALWGFPDADTTTMMDRFQARYHGKRYSFGYPACPDLEMQTQLFQLLDAASIGVHLTDGFMMDPEASVSAMVFHHPDAKYFAV